MIVKYITGAVFVALALAEDIKYVKIKNKLILFFLLAGFVEACIAGGVSGLLHSAAGAAVPLLPLFALRFLGAGDIKSFCVLGAIFGVKGVIEIMALSIIFGGLIAFGFMIYKRNALERFKALWLYFKLCLSTKKILPYSGINNRDAVFRFGYAIASGFAVYAAYNLYIM